MRRLALPLVVLFLAALLAPACVGTTGSGIVSFRAYAGATPGISPTFTNGLGWTITLTRAKLHIGGLYLNRSVPVSGGQERSCILPGVYVAQVLDGLDVDALDPTLQPFPSRGTGTADPAITGEVWLTGGRVDALDDRTVIADVAGTATRAGTTLRFQGAITIGQNRAPAETDPARPGASPLCAQRIVSPIPVAITPTEGGALVVRIDPRTWFANVELGDLDAVSADSDLRLFTDDGATQPAANLYLGLRAATGPYTLTWEP